MSDQVRFQDFQKGGGGGGGAIVVLKRPEGPSHPGGAEEGPSRRVHPSPNPPPLPKSASSDCYESSFGYMCMLILAEEILETIHDNFHVVGPLNLLFEL